jgi:transcriptional regulator with XRE-family HTH domain
VRRLRDERAWTLEVAATAMDVDLKHLQKIEAGQLNLTMVTILRIADGLEVAPEILFEGIPLKARRRARVK